MTPNDKLCTAISILQAHVGAMDSPLNPVALWGKMHMPSLAVEQAVKLLTEIVDQVPDRVEER